MTIVCQHSINHPCVVAYLHLKSLGGAPGEALRDARHLSAVPADDGLNRYLGLGRLIDSY